MFSFFIQFLATNNKKQGSGDPQCLFKNASNLLLLLLGSSATAADSEDCVKSGRKCQKRLQSKLNAGRLLTLIKTRRRKILISGKGKFGGEVFFCSGSECGFYRKNKGQD